MAGKRWLRDTLLSLTGKIVETIASRALDEEGTPPEAFWEAVKLIHAEDLKGWDALKAYEEHQSITYAEYRRGRERLQRWERAVREPLAARQRLAELDVDEEEEYEAIEVSVPASLFRGRKEIRLPEPPYRQTTMTTRVGEIHDGRLLVKATWRDRTLRVRRFCPSRVRHAEEIAGLRARLAALTPEERETLQRIDESRFSDPVLFVSHRWESTTHPDPKGSQLTKLRALRDCYLIYDYSSFPQDTVEARAQATLSMVLSHMNALIERVIVLRSDEYVERGWCIYEYILASLKMSIVCDEINDPVFVTLRNLRATRAPAVPGESAFRPSAQSEIQNRIDEDLLRTVNHLLPRFQASLFTVEPDRAIVSELLLTQLLEVLPPRREHQTYLGEWRTIPWTREELKEAFQRELSWERLQASHRLNPYRLRVPSTISDAVENDYALDAAPPANALTFLDRVWGRD